MAKMSFMKGYWANFNYRKTKTSGIEKIMASLPSELRARYTTAQQRLEESQELDSEQPSYLISLGG
jgi:hypothetical protein